MPRFLYILILRVGRLSLGCVPRFCPIPGSEFSFTKKTRQFLKAIGRTISSEIGPSHQGSTWKLVNNAVVCESPPRDARIIKRLTGTETRISMGLHRMQMLSENAKNSCNIGDFESVIVNDGVRA
jgi:hypothetical protein